jgi:hypothetical protein
MLKNLANSQIKLEKTIEKDLKGTNLNEIRKESQ